MAKEIYLGIHQNEIINSHGIPQLYQEVEWIGGKGNGQNTGPYINTGVMSGAGYSVDCNVSIPDPGDSSNSRALLGANITVESFIDEYQSKFGGYLGVATRFTIPFTITADQIYQLQFVANLGAQKVNIDGTDYHTANSSTLGNLPVYLFAVSDTNTYGVWRTGTCRFHGPIKIYDNGGALARNYIPCYRKADQVAGLYDLVTNTFYANNGSGRFDVGSDVTDKPEGEFARHIPKFYLGIDNVARWVRKAYMGVAGVARPCFGGGTLTYYGKIANLNIAQRLHGGATLGKGLYAIFGGGQRPDNDATDITTAYDKSYTKYSPASLSIARIDVLGAAAGSYGLLAGGDYMWSYDPIASVDVYDAQLTHTTGDNLSAAKHSSAAASFGDYAVFAGGRTEGGYSQIMDCYDATLTHTTVAIKTAAARNAAAAIGKKCLIVAGGEITSNVTAAADAYDAEFVRLSVGDLSQARKDLTGVGNGKYAIFAGGRDKNNKTYATVDAYDANLTRITVPVLNVNRMFIAGGSIDGYAVFAGGNKNDDWLGETTVDAYDENLTKVDVEQLTDKRRDAAAAIVGDSILIAGGMAKLNSLLDTVEVYTII